MSEYKESGNYIITNENPVKKIEEETNVKLRDTGLVTLADLYNELGILFPSPTYDENGDLMDPYEWGWTESKGFHRLTIKEKNPYFCPCCGRPW